MSIPTEKKRNKRKSAATETIDEETLDVARMLVEEKRLAKAARAKWRPRGKGASADDAIVDAIREKSRSHGDIMNQIFARTVEDTVLANTFRDKSGKIVRHLSVRKAKAMDGLRDLDDTISNSGVGVDPARANPMNPEGRFAVPTASAAHHEFAERFNEAMNPRNIRTSVIPELILDHYAQYSTFIGYPMCEVLGTHPTISNACLIPGQDAIAPGYKLQFIDSEDVDGNGIPDDLETVELGAVKMSLEKIKSMEALKDAVRTISGNGGDGKENSVESLNALALSLERLAAYEEWERTRNGDDAAAAVREGFIEPVSRALTSFTGGGKGDVRKDALATLSLALADLARKDHPTLDQVRADKSRRETIIAVGEAVESVSGFESEDWDKERALNDLAVAVERAAAYQSLNDKNAEMVAGLTMAVTNLATKQDPDARRDAMRALTNVQSAMDSGEFAFDNPNTPTEEQGGNEQPMPSEQGPMPPQQPMEDPKAKEDEEQKKAVDAANMAQERQKLLDSWKKRADEMGINKVCERIVRNARMFGIGIAVPIVDGADYERPFNIDDVKPGAYQGFSVIEPTWIYPETESEDLVNPLSPSFFEPSYWAVTGSTSVGNMSVRRIHKSWMVIYRHKEVPNMLRPMYYYGGIPLTQELYEPVFIADKLMNEVPKLAMTKRTTVVKGDPNDMIVNPEGVVDRLRAYSQVQDNFGILYVGRNADVQKLETSLSEFDQLIAKANQRIAAIAEMPETKLFKTQLAGMNSAGRYEWDDYSQLLINIQNNVLIPLLSVHYKLDTKSQNGSVIPVKIAFNPIDVPTEAEREENESRGVQTINQAIQGGWLAPSEGRIIARTREGSMFSAIPAAMPEELLQQAQQQQGGGMPGMPGMGGEGGPGGGDPMAALGGIMGGGQGGEGGMPPMPKANPGAGSPLDALDAPKEPSAPTERK